MRSTVPYPTVATNSIVHTLVMMRPTGKIPRVLPGSAKVAALAAAEAVALLPEVDVTPGNANMPLTKDASLDDSIVVTDFPLGSVPVRVIRGVKSVCTLTLEENQHRDLHECGWVSLRIVEILHPVAVDLTHELHFLNHGRGCSTHTSNPTSVRR